MYSAVAFAIASVWDHYRYNARMRRMMAIEMKS